MAIEEIERRLAAARRQWEEVSKQLLLKDKDQLARALAEKLLSYGTGGTPSKSDQPEIEAIVARVRPKEYGLRTLVHEVVQSKVFQSK